MNKILLTLLAISVTFVIGQPCNSNLLTRQFEITPLQQATPSQNLNFCNSLKSTTTCCEASFINSIQERSEALTTRLTNLVSSRDKFLIDTRKSVYGLRNVLQRLKTASERAINVLSSSNNIDNSGGSSGLPGFEMDLGMNFVIGMFAVGISEMATQITGNITNLQANFTSYQETRRECVIEIVKVQAAAWCLACDPNSETKGLGRDSFVFGTDLRTRILNKCFPFLALSDNQNNFLVLHYMSAAFNTIATALERIARGDVAGGTQDFFLSFVSIQSSAPSAAPEKKPVQLPDGCTEKSCNWIFQELFKDGKINETLLAAGGKFDESDEDSAFGRFLKGREEDNDDVDTVIKVVQGRKLLSGEWNPVQDEAGIQVNFAVNPANVDNKDLSGFKTALVGFSLAALGVLFF